MIFFQSYFGRWDFQFIVRDNQISFLEDSKKINLYQAMDKIRYKFGEDKVGRAV